MARSASLIPIILLATACVGGNGGAYALQAGEAEPATPSFALYVLSRGKGVPEPARNVLRDARAMLEEAKQEGKVVGLKQTRIGLEGETRLCAEFTDSDAAREMRERIARLMQGVELVNLVVEPCSD